MENRLHQQCKCATINDFFAECDPKTVTCNRNKFNKRGQGKMKRIFRAFTDLFLLDIIENNSIFAMYSSLGSTIEICMAQVDRDYIVRNSWMFEDLDWLTTDFTAYVPMVVRNLKGKVFRYPILYRGMNRVIEKNNNLEYNTLGETKTVDNYLEELHELFPDESTTRLRRVVSYGMLQLKAWISEHVRISLAGNQFTYRIGLIKYGKKNAYKITWRRIKVNGPEPDGWYYFGIAKSRYETINYIEGSRVNFGTVRMYNTVYPTFLHKYTYIFAVPMFEDLGRKYIKEDFITRHAIQIAERVDGKYKFIDNGWKCKDTRWRRERLGPKRTTDCNKNWWDHHVVKFR